MATQATEWLTGNRDYDAGLQILKDNGASEFLVDILSTGADQYNTPKLIDEIKKLAQLQQQIIPVDEPEDGRYLQDQQEADAQLLVALSLNPEKVGELVESPASIYTPDENLERKLRIDQQIRQLFKEMTHLHGQLSKLPEGEELHQVARDLRIKDLKKQDLFDQKHYFEQNGRWFDENEPENLQAEDLEKVIKNLMSNRSKAKTELKKPLPDAQKAHYERKIKELTDKITQYQAKRNVKA